MPSSPRPASSASPEVEPSPRVKRSRGRLQRVRWRRLSLLLLVPVIGIAGAIALTSRGAGSDALTPATAAQTTPATGAPTTDAISPTTTQPANVQPKTGALHKPAAKTSKTHAPAPAEEEGQVRERASPLDPEPHQDDAGDGFSLALCEHDSGPLEPARFDADRLEPPRHNRAAAHEQHLHRRDAQHRLGERISNDKRRQRITHRRLPFGQRLRIREQFRRERHGNGQRRGLSRSTRTTRTRPDRPPRRSPTATRVQAPPVPVTAPPVPAFTRSRARCCVRDRTLYSVS